MAFIEIPQQFANIGLDDLAAQAGGRIPLIPEGRYSAVVVESGLKETQSGGMMLVCKFVITQGPQANTELLHHFNIKNANPVAEKIAFGELAKLAKAAGLPSLPQESNSLHGKPLVIVIKTEKGQPYTDKNTGEMREGKDKSIIYSFEPLPQAVSAPIAQQAPKIMPWEK